MRRAFAAGRGARLVAAFVCLLGAPSCLDSVRACTEIGCGPPFQVNFSPGTGWPAGTYVVAVTADGVSARCSATLPLSCQRESICEGERQWTLIQSGCALPPTEHAIGGVFFQKAPTSVRISVSLDDRELAAGEFMPTYATSRPNGEGCEPVCRTARSAEMNVEIAP